MRKLVTVRTIGDLQPIPNADAIEVATIGGWKVVVKKGDFLVGEPCVYFEIDSFLPESDPRYSFLMKAGVREFEGVRGHRLRTIKLRGQISQGLALPLSLFPELAEAFEEFSDVDVDALLGIKKWEAPVSPGMTGKAKGSFPPFLRKTDQERCQNLAAEIFGFDEKLVPVDTSGMNAAVLQKLLARGVFREVDGVVKKVIPGKDSREDRYEVTLKLDGSSCTLYHKDGQLGVCSRNLELDMTDTDNAMVKAFTPELQNAMLRCGLNLALQGEIMGPGIQGNREDFKAHRLFFFNVFDIDRGEYLSPDEHAWFFEHLPHAPVLHTNVTLAELGITNMDELLAFANGPSLNNPVREGLVFKRMDGKFSFKVISNQYLLKEKA